MFVGYLLQKNNEKLFDERTSGMLHFGRPINSFLLHFILLNYRYIIAGCVFSVCVCVCVFRYLLLLVAVVAWLLFTGVNI